MTSPSEQDVKKISQDAQTMGDDISQLARAAIDAIRSATDDFAAKAGVAKSETVDALKHAGKSAVDGLGVAAEEARAVTETGLDQIGKAVVRNPISALAIAAAAGLVLGLLTRPQSSNRQDTRR
jgi:ElaB/YqjD/DUF883 family membrane-anchored ribosome-binding protein